MPVGAAIGGAAIIGAGAAMYSSNKAADAQQEASQQAAEAQQQAGQRAADSQVEAARLAADAQLQASRESNALQDRMYNQNRADMAPWRRTGRNALQQLSDLTGVAYGDNTAQMVRPMGGAQNRASGQLQALMNAPGYQFRLAEGNKSLDRSAAARGGLFSGATLKALSRYNQDYASNEYDKQWNRLSAMANVGQSATSQTGAWGQATANNMSNGLMATGNALADSYARSGSAQANNFMNAGNARASNYINRGNAIANNYTQNGQTIGNLAGDAAKMYGYYYM